MVCGTNSERAGVEKVSASPEASGKAQVKKSLGLSTQLIGFSRSPSSIHLLLDFL